MKTVSAATRISLLASLLVSGCATVPYTNRRQINLISADQEQGMGLQAFTEVKTKNKMSTDTSTNALVEKVGRRIARAADRPDYQWEFVVIDDPKTVNAFCLPGGKVAVYTGILPLTKDENGLAVVLGHEVSHALAHHGAERISDQTLMTLPLEVLVQNQTDATKTLVSEAFGIGVTLPFNRKQESEADHIGLILMSKAGYDPRNAVTFWERMTEATKGQAPPAFLSDHPSDAQRIQKIKDELPEALTYYKP